MHMICVTIRWSVDFQDHRSTSVLHELTLTTLKYFHIYKPWRQISVKIIILSASFEYLCYGSTDIIIFFNSSSVGTVLRRKNLKSADVRFWLLNTVPTVKEWTISPHLVDTDRQTIVWLKFLHLQLMPAIHLLYETYLINNTVNKMHQPSKNVR